MFSSEKKQDLLTCSCPLSRFVVVAAAGLV
jgi:hypothetical protein